MLKIHFCFQVEKLRELVARLTNERDHWKGQSEYWKNLFDKSSAAGGGGGNLVGGGGDAATSSALAAAAAAAAVSGRRNCCRQM